MLNLLRMNEKPDPYPNTGRKLAGPSICYRPIVLRDAKSRWHPSLRSITCWTDTRCWNYAARKLSPSR